MDDYDDYPDPLDYDDGVEDDQYEVTGCGESDSDYDESMDGDFDSAMASAGWGTDEDYGSASDIY